MASYERSELELADKKAREAVWIGRSEMVGKAHEAKPSWEPQPFGVASSSFCGKRDGLAGLK